MASPSVSNAVCRFCQNIFKTKLVRHHPVRHLTSVGKGTSRSLSQSPGEKWGTSSSNRGQCLYSTGTNQNPTVYVENNETIIRSNYDDVEIVDKGFGEFMFSYLDQYKDLEAMVNSPTGETYTGAQIKDLTIRVASGLRKLGYRKGDVVVLFATNCPEFTILFLACALMGMPVSPANPVYTPEEVAGQLSHSGAKSVVTMEAMLPTVREAIASSKELSTNIKHIFTFHSSPAGCYPFKTLMEDDGREFPENVDIDPDNDILTLPYSSGTTGMPKGVMLTHRNMVMNLVQGMNGQMKFRPGEEVLLGLLPFYHIYGLMVLQFGSLTQGGKLIVLPKFEPETFLQAIQDYKVTYAHLVPPLILFLAKYPMVHSFQTSSLKTLVSAAAPLGEGVTKEAEDRLNCHILQAYGLTETSPITHHDESPPNHGTIGRLIPSTRAKIIDRDTGKNLGVGEAGEILIKGPQVMKGYYKNQAATDGCFQDGWFHTGDVGHADSEGFFTISDRIKELIKYKGLQIAPAELEALLCTHPAIQDAAVVGIPVGAEQGEVPRAFVVAKPGVNVKEMDILEFVSHHVAPYKKLRGGVQFVDEIPKTASGKILRRMLK